MVQDRDPRWTTLAGLLETTPSHLGRTEQTVIIGAIRSALLSTSEILGEHLSSKILYATKQKKRNKDLVRFWYIMESPQYHGNHDVPGTILLYDADHDSVNRPHRVNIVLHPTPSNDPEDPLNWTQRRKHLAISMVYLYTFTIGICTAAQYSILTPISEAQDISISQLNLGTGLMQLMQGWCCLLWQPIAMTYGRRCVYILTIVLSIGPMIWTPFSHGAGQWYAHRILLGIACCPVESLPEVSVPDLFFAHERGKYMALYAFVLFGSNFLAPFFAGFINDRAGWQWVMYFATILIVICSIIMYFFTEETIYFRQTTEGMTANPTDAKIDEDNETPDVPIQQEHVDSSTVSHDCKTWAQKLSLTTKLPGRPSNKQMFLKSWRSLKIIVLFPNILWAGLLYGSNLSWYSVINATISMMLSSSPYNFKPDMVGVSYLSPLVFGAAASVWSGHFADALTLKLAKRNGGIREPEQRLWFLAVPAIMTTGGLLMWGLGASFQVHYMVLIMGIGVTTFGVICASAISLAYAVDCFKEISGESFVSIIIIRNTMGFAFSYAITPWIEGVGLRDCFISVSFLSLFFTSTFIPMIFWGKPLRKWSADRYWRYVAAERGELMSR